VTVREALSKSDLKRFIDLPYRLHKRDPLWVPPLRRDVALMLDRARNPFFQHAEASYFLAERDGAVVGRIAAIANRLHNETHDDKVGFFGFFECEDRQDAADALFEQAANWLRARGFDTMRGPASFSVNDECGLLVDGFDTPPVLMMPHNPPSYIRLVESAGFATARNLLVYQGGDPTLRERRPAPERLTRAVGITRERLGITVRPIDLKRFDDEVEAIKRVYNAAWEKNWGFVPMTEAEIDHLAKQFRPVVMPELVGMMEKDGEVIGFGLALPDLNQVFRHNRRGYLLPVLPRLLWALKTGGIHRIRIPLLGVVPEYRGKGLDAVLYHYIWSNGQRIGMRWGEAGWILEDNTAMNLGLEKMGFTVYKTYRLYDRPL
jgi:GNAT superfamily N-acetyltransferase